MVGEYEDFNTDHGHVKGLPSVYSGLYKILVNWSVLLVVGIVYQPDVIYNIDGLILSALKYILSCLCPKMIPKTKYEKPLPSLLLYKWILDVANRILGVKG